MAKFSRFDPRNKKSGKHKNQSQNKDIRIREVDEYSRRGKQVLQEVVYDNENDIYDKPQQLNS